MVMKENILKKESSGNKGLKVIYTEAICRLGLDSAHANINNEKSGRVGVVIDNGCLFRVVKKR
jgi:hypothetical protein